MELLPLGPEAYTQGVFKDPYGALWHAILADGPDECWHLGSFPTFAEAGRVYLETKGAFEKCTSKE